MTPQSLLFPRHIDLHLHNTDKANASAFFSLPSIPRSCGVSINRKKLSCPCSLLHICHHSFKEYMVLLMSGKAFHCHTDTNILNETKQNKTFCLIPSPIYGNCENKTEHLLILRWSRYTLGKCNCHSCWWHLWKWQGQLSLPSWGLARDLPKGSVMVS